MSRNRFVICLNVFKPKLGTTGKEALGAVHNAETNFPALARGAFFLQCFSKQTFPSNLRFIFSWNVDQIEEHSGIRNTFFLSFPLGFNKSQRSAKRNIG